MGFLIWLQSRLKIARMQYVPDKHCAKRADRRDFLAASIQNERPAQLPSFSAIPTSSGLKGRRV